MKAYKIVIFIFLILGGLAFICRAFPKEGISVCGILFEFPSLTEVLDVPSAKEDDLQLEPELTPEQLMQQRLDALKTAKENEFLDYCAHNPARIYFPSHETTYLDDFFDALEQADKKALRIMHYGDSQLECDRITGNLREEFQAKFGGSGVGLIPAVQTIATYTLGQTASPEGISRKLIYGPTEMRASHNRYGVMGQMARVDGNAYFTFSTRGGKDYEHAQTFSEVTLWAQGNVSARITTADTTIQLVTQDTIGVRMFKAHLPRTVRKASLAVSGNMDIYGILLDGKKGVSVDNIPMRGCSGTMFNRISAETLSPFYTQENVRLIILQYGGNSVPYLKNKKGIENYKKNLCKQIAYMKAQAPKSKFLFIGPADMATSIKGKMQTYPQMEEVVKAIREAANESGIAFWDLYASMGGYGSMVKWVDARPQLAGPDYIHFTPKGARKVSHMLFETIQLYYKFYRFRTGKDKVVLPEDSIQKNDSLRNDTIRKG